MTQVYNPPHHDLIRIEDGRVVILTFTGDVALRLKPDQARTLGLAAMEHGLHLAAEAKKLPSTEGADHDRGSEERNPGGAGRQ